MPENLGRTIPNTSWLLTTPPFFFFLRKIYSLWLSAGVPTAMGPFFIDLEEHFELLLTTNKFSEIKIGSPTQGGTLLEAVSP